MWRCSCSANLTDEQKFCSKCGTAKASLPAPAMSPRLKKGLKTAAMVAAIAIFLTGAALLTAKAIIPNAKYNRAITLMESGQYSDAIRALPGAEKLSG